MPIRSVCLAVPLLLVFVPDACGQFFNFNDPRIEAEYLALEVGGQLTPSVPLANQIQADLAAIRLAFPQYANIRVLPDWLPGETLIGMTPDAYSEFKAGSFHGFDSLYATLGTPMVAAHNAGQWLHVQFGQMYHGMRLSEMFDPVSGVRYAEPNGIIGDGDDVVARSNRTYTLSRGSGDCLSGCIYRESWDFTVTNQGVFLGTPPPNGDFNGDGAVDTADYVLLRNGWGASYNQTHYNAWRTNFGTTPGGGATAGSLVPEPAGGALLVLGLAITHLRPSRRGSQDWAP